MAGSKFAGVGASFTRNTSSLLNDASKKLAVKQETIKFLPRESLHYSPEEVTVYPNWKSKLDALALDISKRGIQNPIVVCPTEDGEYEIVSGHRRTAANDIAVEKYGYESGAMVPCIIRKSPVNGREFERAENLILSNLQRDKSDYEHMMEIVGIRRCAEERKKTGEDIPSTRDYVISRLGVSSTEVTRYDKIFESLDSGLMDMFRGEFIASTVAYELARMPLECQAFIHEHIPHDEVLSLPRTAELQALWASEQLSGSSGLQPATSGSEAKKPAQKPSVPVPKSFEEGTAMLESAFTGISSALSSSHPEIDKKDRVRLLKKIQKQTVALQLLQMELASFGLVADDGE